ncbi:MAG: flagellar biosynthesis protein FlgD, partial [Acidovorax sp. 17-64-282]
MINSATSATSGSTAVSTTATRADTTTDASAGQDRFLKLLVAQLNNQDPMNPLDNAQMTSQIAQINTVTGIQQLNDTVKGLVSQFAAQQMLQGSAMVG